MEKRRIRSLEVSVIGLGCNNFGWRIDESNAAAVVNAAMEEGINFFDTADVYANGKSEEYLGRALGKRRSKVVVATKFGMKMEEQRKGARPEYVHQAAESSLRRLGTDFIDLYQLHEPDPTVPLADTIGAMEELVSAGKVVEIGCSNFSAEQLREAGGRFASVQNQYSLMHRDPEKDVLPESLDRGIAFLPYFPLASGLLTGKYRRGQPLPEGSRGKDQWGPKVFTDRNLELVERLIRYAESKQHTILELAFSWLGSSPAVASVIAGATSSRQVQTNARAANWELNRDELAEINELLGSL